MGGAHIALVVWLLNLPEIEVAFEGLNQCLRLKSSMPFKIYLSQNNSSNRNPKMKMKTSLEILNTIAHHKNQQAYGFVNTRSRVTWLFLILHIVLKTCTM
jgi:hypothetical protein